MKITNINVNNTYRSDVNGDTFVEKKTTIKDIKSNEQGVLVETITTKNSSEKIASLKKQIQDGKYLTDNEAIARKMLDKESVVKYMKDV